MRDFNSQSKVRHRREYGRERLSSSRGERGESFDWHKKCGLEFSQLVLTLGQCLDCGQPDVSVELMRPFRIFDWRVFDEARSV